MEHHEIVITTKETAIVLIVIQMVVIKDLLNHQGFQMKLITLKMSQVQENGIQVIIANNSIMKLYQCKKKKIFRKMLSCFFFRQKNSNPNVMSLMSNQAHQL